MITLQQNKTSKQKLVNNFQYFLIYLEFILFKINLHFSGFPPSPLPLSHSPPSFSFPSLFFPLTLSFHFFPLSPNPLILRSFSIPSLTLLSLSLLHILPYSSTSLSFFLIRVLNVYTQRWDRTALLPSLFSASWMLHFTAVHLVNFHILLTSPSPFFRADTSSEL